MKCNTAVTANTIIAAAIFAAMSAPANAESYAGIRYVGITSDSTLLSAEWSLPLLMVNVGNQLNPNWAVEARLGIGIGDDTAEVTLDNTTSNVNVKYDNYIGAFLRWGASSGRMQPYLMLGYGQIDATATVEGFSFDSDGDDAAFGGGVNIAFTDSVSGNLEYMQYLKTSRTEVTGIAFGLEYDF